MRVFVIGQGGREHALCRALKYSPNVTAVYVSPGSDGMSDVAETLGELTQTQIIEACLQKKIDLVVIGPEAELVSGLPDLLRKRGIPVFGSSMATAKLEASKVFCKEFLNEFRIPTAKSIVVTSVKSVEFSARDFTPPYVLKADGLCAGKGVFICADKSELLACAKNIFENKSLGTAGEIALLEQFQSGYELSVLYLTNGKSFSRLPICQDHKRLLDDDKGPNTGGMGAVGPVQIDQLLLSQIEDKILKPIQAGFQKRQFDYRGVLYVGLMITPLGPQVLEFNVRFGDPEAQVILPLLHGDWAEAFMSVAKGEAPHLNWRDEYAACVVLAAEGYPEAPKKGIPIQGEFQDSTQNSYFLHAGTKKIALKNKDQFVTNGGRVLNAVGIDSSLSSAIQKAYALTKKISWPGMQFRKDIGSKV